MRISAGQCRAARALLAWKQQELTEKSGVSLKTIADFERGASTPYPRTMRDIVATFEAAGLLFLPPQEGVHSGAVGYKWGFDFSMLGGATTGTSPSNPRTDLSAMEWDALDEYAEALQPNLNQTPRLTPPLTWTAEDRANQIIYWRERPEKWASLADVSRQCLLRAMGVERL